MDTSLPTGKVSTLGGDTDEGKEKRKRLLV